MDKPMSSMVSLPERSVSEDGTFCESFNDAISRLEHEIETAGAPKHPRPQSLQLRHSGSGDLGGSSKHKPARPGAGPDAESGSGPSAKRNSERNSEPNGEANGEANGEPNGHGQAGPASGSAPVSEAPPQRCSGAAGGTFAYNRHNESIFDDARYFPYLHAEQSTVAKFDAKQPELLSHATLRALVVQLTSPAVIDYNLICDFFLTYRTFTDAAVVLRMLLTRLVWALQYINAPAPELVRLGKLVLLRTFVVMRHWILNYFLDDFEGDERLCDMFAQHINEITGELALVRADMAFEVKILADLKTHWLNQISAFFARAVPGESPTPAVFGTPLPMAAEYRQKRALPASATEVSIHTNPSFRRLAMLSLYDQGLHHKCLPHDGLATPDAALLPISHLVSQHQLSRVSLAHPPKAPELPFAARRAPAAPKHNHMNLTDSSLALKKTRLARLAVPSARPCNVALGFSTNGQIKLPSPRIAAVVPLAPVYRTRPDSGELAPPAAPLADGVARKRSIKRVVEDWTRSLYSPDMRSDVLVFSMADLPAELPCGDGPGYPPASRGVDGRVDVLSARIVDELEFVMRYYLQPPAPKVRPALPEPADLAAGRPRESAATTQRDTSVQDISELNIEKIDNLFSQGSIGDQTGDQMGDQTGASGDWLGLPRHATTGRSHESKQSSFGGRVASINWNDDGDFLENLGLLCDSSARRTTRFYDVSAELEIQRVGAEGLEDEALCGDTGPTASPRSLPGKHTLRSSLHHQFTSGSLGKHASSLARTSGDFVALRESMKSYTSYDSAYSLSDRSKGDEHGAGLKKKHGFHDLRRLAQDGNLHSLFFARISASSNVSGGFRMHRASMASKASSSGIKNCRLSALCALMELPFSLARDSSASASTRAFGNDDSAKALDLSVSSVFSNAAGRDQRYNRDSTDEQNIMSSASVAIPGININILRELASIPDETFTSKNPVQYALSKLEGRYISSEIVAKGQGDPYTRDKQQALELERVVLHEVKNARRTVAVIEREEDDLLTRALLEKERPASADARLAVRVSEPVARDGHTEVRTEEPGALPATPQSLPLPVVSEEHRNQDTENILAEIHDAKTEDAIGYSSDIEYELQRRPITPIKRKSRSTVLLSASTSNMNGATTDNGNGSPLSLMAPKLVLDVYHLASEHLTVNRVLATGSHVSFILSYDAKVIAEHFTLIERDIMQDIDWKELIELQWNKDLTPVNSWLEIIVNDEYYHKNRGVNLVIARFNLVVNWTISEILLTTDQDEQRDIVTRFIHIAFHSYEMQNFSTLMQMVLALTSEKVSKLKSTWDRVSPSDIAVLEQLEKVTLPSKNFVSMRVSTNQITPSKGCIPFAGLYLSDLIFNAERPKFVKKKEPAKNTTATTNEDSCEISVTQGDSTMGSIHGFETEKMINFARFRTSVHIVKSLSQSIEWSQNYDFTVDDELLRKCLYITSLDEEEMNVCLRHTEA